MTNITMRNAAKDAICDVISDLHLTPNRKRPRSQSAEESPTKKAASRGEMDDDRRTRRASPPKCAADQENENLLSSQKSPNKLQSTQLSEKSRWNPRDPAHMQAVKQILHIATSPDNVVCRCEEQKTVLEFCKACIEQEKAGSMYVCGCPGTGKTLTIGRVQKFLLQWSKEEGLPAPDSLAINCTSLTSTTEIFSKILAKIGPGKKTNNIDPPLKYLQNLFSIKGSANSSKKMLLLIVDELDYLVTKDRAVLHDLFMLTTLPFSRCILIGIANAIDLADRFLPKLESLNCKPTVVTFPAYSKDQILMILKQRLKVLGFDVFQHSALEFCARKVAAASGDMRRALGVCRSAIEVLEAQLRNAAEQEIGIVSFDHMDIALSKAFKSTVVNTIQSLPQHQQIVLCSVVKLFRQSKKNATTIGELIRSYLEMCRFTQIPPVCMMEFTDMCRVLSDQGLLQLGKSKDNKSKRVTLKVDSSEISFAFKDMRFFQNCLQQC